MHEVSVARFLRLIRRFGLFGLTCAVFHHVLGSAIARMFPRATQRAVQTFLGSDNTAQTLILISTLDWYFPFRQRLHHLANAFAAAGWKIIFVSPSAGYDQFLFSRLIENNIIVIKNHYPLFDAIPITSVYFCSVDNRFDLDFFNTIRNRGGKVIYDYIDAIDDRLSNRKLTTERSMLHDALLADEKHCYVIGTASEIMKDIKKYRAQNFSLVTNAVFLEHFCAPRTGNNIRQDFKAIVDTGKPIAGYYGALAEWLDYELLIRLALALPNISIVLIGPDYDGSKDVLSDAPPNLFVLPPIEYQNLAVHAAWFDVALIPFLVNEITDSTSPLKLFEYMAAKIPIVSTDIKEARKYNSVHIGRNPSEFVEFVNEIVLEGVTDEYMAKMEDEAKENSWENKIQIIVDDIEAMDS